MAFEALSGDPFEALGDEHRRTIVELLRTGDRSVQQLADHLPISRPAVSRHLRLLKRAGLVTDRAEGTRRLYRLHDEGIAAVHAYLRQVWGDAAARFRLAAENFTEPGTVPEPGSAKRVADLRSELPAEPGRPDLPGDGGTQR